MHPLNRIVVNVAIVAAVLLRLIQAEATSVVVALVAPVDAAFDAAADDVFPYFLFRMIYFGFIIRPIIALLWTLF
jgi:hypothetical protein